MSDCVLGVDPGLTTGIAWYSAVGTWHVAQCSPFLARRLLVAVLSETTGWHIGVERFVVRSRAGKSNSPEARDETLSLISFVEHLATKNDHHCTLRNAGDVKPWATDDRLDEAGVLKLCKGMGHARDAARHALFTGVKAGLMTDPLSRRKYG